MILQRCRETTNNSKRREEVISGILVFDTSLLHRHRLDECYNDEKG